MSAHRNSWGAMQTLVKREFLEQRLLFIQLPLGLTLLFIAMNGYRMLTGVASIGGVDSTSVRSIMVVNSYIYPAVFTLAAYSLSMLFYFLMTLYQQRKNRSILFWNSLPVSGAQTVVSKLISGVLCYLFYILCAVVQGAGTLLIAAIYGWHTGVDSGDLFATRFSPLTYLEVLVLQVPLDLVWVLPVYAWLLLASAHARQAPFVWAVGPLLAVAVIDIAAFADNLLIFDSWIARKFLAHALPQRIMEPELASFDVYYSWPELGLSALLGVLLVCAAVRYNRSDAS